jgi:signal transduction histidine kinase
LKEDARDLTGRTVPELLNLPPVQFEDLFNHTNNKSVEAVCQLSNGDRIPVELSVSHFDDAEQTSMLLTLRDLSDRYAAERLKQEFMAMVGHDLKMPLSVVNCFLELLEGGNLGQLNETGERLRNRTMTQLERLDRLVADLADVSQIESSTFSLERQDASLLKLAALAEGTVHDAAESRQIKIEIQNMDHQVFVDPGRITQVLTNLLVNAVKFSPDSSTITVDSIKENKSILVRVRDQGRGVPEEAKERIFERFQQVSPSDARIKGGLGMGLGLAICKSIVSQHGGVIGVDSEPGKGSTFWFRLPLVAT